MQKYVNLVDLVKSFPTSIYLQKSASIQPRTSLSKFGGKFNSLFIRLLRQRQRRRRPQRRRRLRKATALMTSTTTTRMRAGSTSSGSPKRGGSTSPSRTTRRRWRFWRTQSRSAYVCSNSKVERIFSDFNYRFFKTFRKPFLKIQ